MEKQMQYIINAVLIPQITYLTTDYIPSDKILDSLDSKICNLLKRTCKLQKTIPSTFLYNKNICNILSIKQKVHCQAILELINSLNYQKDRIYTQSTLICCQALQNKMWSPQKIWNISFLKNSKIAAKYITSFILSKL